MIAKYQGPLTHHSAPNNSEPMTWDDGEPIRLQVYGAEFGCHELASWNDCESPGASGWTERTAIVTVDEQLIFIQPRNKAAEDIFGIVLGTRVISHRPTCRGLG